MQSPFLMTDFQGNLALAPNLFTLLVAIVTSTLHLAVITNHTIDRIDKLYGEDSLNSYGNQENEEEELTFCETFFFAIEKLLCLFWFCFRWIVCWRKKPKFKGSNKNRQLAYAKKFRDEMNSVMFLQISLIVFIILRILLFSFGLKEILMYDLLIVGFAFLSLGFFWPLVFLKITFGSKKL